MKPNSTLLSLALLLGVLKCRGNRTEEIGDTYNNEVNLGSEEFLGKWLGNVSEVELTAEWSSWKTTHRKKYSTSLQDLERYVVWRSNKAYINYHNSFASTFGFYLSMNKFGDMVRFQKSTYLKIISDIGILVFVSPFLMLVPSQLHGNYFAHNNHADI